MAIAIITGSSGLIGSEAAQFFHEKGFEIVGIDNDLRSYFFGKESSTAWNTQRLSQKLNRFSSHAIDIRNQAEIFKLFKKYGSQIELVIHAAAQPSHDWAAREPFTDFTVNANGTLVLLEATRQFSPAATFIFTSTNKVYGDTPNTLPLVETKLRWEIDSTHPYFQHGIDESMSIDSSKHSLFGASKVAADILVQEYGRYFGMKTGIFRGGCLTGPMHSGAELHGFLAYLVQCGINAKSYNIYGYQGKQVRDNIHSYDLVNAFWHFSKRPRIGAVYNMGGSRHSNCSVLEAIEKIENLTGNPFRYQVIDQARSGDHIWWISDIRKFQNDYPEWEYQYNIDSILKEMVEASASSHRKAA
ncbi:MAG: NAD-dependent epimerase/dehydratase family protein [Proteobacteria bacterium]|nr:NAD-dependent epimerase/dehydratase family protein [Pseudomonadota bacterium]